MQKVIEEITYIQETKFYKSIMIQDDTFPENRIMEFCERKMAWKIPWSCYVRPNITDYKLLKKMKQAGCLNLHVGYESASRETLKRVKKGILPGEMEHFTHRAKQAGLRIHGDFLIGVDETTGQILRTIDWACKLNPDTAQFQIYIPYFEKPIHQKEWLVKLARYAYRKFYRRPHTWPTVIKQTLKPSILRESVKTILGVNR